MSCSLMLRDPATGCRTYESHDEFDVEDLRAYRVQCKAAALQYRAFAKDEWNRITKAGYIDMARYYEREARECVLLQAAHGAKP